MLSNLSFIVNTILLVIVTIILAYLIVKNILEKRLISKGISKLSKKINDKILSNEVEKYISNISKKQKQTLKDKINILIQRSNINRFKFIYINAYVMYFINFLIFVAFLKPVYSVLRYVPSTILISFIISLSPYLILDIMGKYNSQKVRRKLAEFISILNRWCTVREDVFYAFEKSIESLSEPLKTYIYEFVIQVKSGIDPQQALDILQLKIDNEQFKDFILNIKQNIESRGDTKKLLSNLERQFYNTEFEFNRRKISTFTDRLAIYVIMVVVLLIGYYLLRFNAEMREFYLTNFTGKNLLTLFCGLYAIGIFFTLKITKYKY